MNGYGELGTEGLQGLGFEYLERPQWPFGCLTVEKEPERESW